MKKTSKRLPLQDLGRALKSARGGRTQRALAADTGFQQAQIARAERGADIRASTLIELARALGLELKLVPRALVPTIEALLDSDGPSGEKPLYALDADG